MSPFVGHGIIDRGSRTVTVARGGTCAEADPVRRRVGASLLRIKEWNCYEVVNPEYGIVLLVYDIGYQGRAVVKWMDFQAGTFEEHGPTLWLTRGSMGLPPSSEAGDE